MNWQPSPDRVTVLLNRPMFHNVPAAVYIGYADIGILFVINQSRVVSFAHQATGSITVEAEGYLCGNSRVVTNLSDSRQAAREFSVNGHPAGICRLLSVGPRHTKPVYAPFPKRATEAHRRHWFPARIRFAWMTQGGAA